MRGFRILGRSALLAALFVAACGTGEGAPDFGSGSASENNPFGQYLVGRFALSQADPTTAATALTRASELAPNEPDLISQAFVANLMAQRTEAVAFARQVPGNPIAQLLVVNDDMRRGNWAEAERRVRSLPRQGAVELLQPMLLAWIDVGAGKYDAALAALRPMVEIANVRQMYALHAGMVADIAGRDQDAERFYGIARADSRDGNLRIAQVVGSWMARHGRKAEAEAMIGNLTAAAADLRIARKDMIAALPTTPVATATDGAAEAYTAIAAALRAIEGRA